LSVLALISFALSLAVVALAVDRRRLRRIAAVPPRAPETEAAPPVQVSELDESCRRAAASLRQTSDELAAAFSQRTAVTSKLASALGAPAAPGGAEKRRLTRVVHDLDACSTSLGDVQRSLGEVAGQSVNLGRVIEHLSSIAAAPRDGGGTPDATESVIDVDRMRSTLASSTTETSELAATLVTTADRGYQAVHQSIDRVERMSTNMQQMMGRIEELNRSLAMLRDVVSIIEDTAKRSHLLALNASIIAAQSGAAGRAFAVVAQEIGELARRTANSVNDIGQRVHDIQTQCDASVAEMGAAANDAAAALKVAMNGGDAVVEMRQAAQEARRSMQRHTKSLASIDQAVRGLASTIAGREQEATRLASLVTGQRQDAVALGQRLEALKAQLARTTEMAEGAAVSVRQAKQAAEQQATAASQPEDETLSSLRTLVAELRPAEARLGGLVARLTEGAAALAAKTKS
jgi:methyl-accepting chemotaxis protein